MVKVTPPNIPETTQKEMAKFFMKTSIPRIIASMESKEKTKKKQEKLEQAENHNESNN